MSNERPTISSHPDHYISLAQHTANHFDQQQLVWGHDHDGAYRQLPLADPETAYVLLQTPQGPTLWHHHVLLFGSAAVCGPTTGSEMSSPTFHDASVASPVVHYVDDYGSINTKQDADSSFHTFAQLNSILGFHMKPSKEQRPDNEHKIQGVIIQCEPQRVSVKPCPNRVRTTATGTPQPPAHKQYDTRRSTQISRQMLLHNNPPSSDEWDEPHSEHYMTSHLAIHQLSTITPGQPS